MNLFLMVAVTFILFNQSLAQAQFYVSDIGCAEETTLETSNFATGVGTTLPAARTMAVELCDSDEHSAGLGHDAQCFQHCGSTCKWNTRPGNSRHCGERFFDESCLPGEPQSCTSSTNYSLHTWCFCTQKI